MPINQVFADPQNLTTPLKSIGYILGLTNVGAGNTFGTVVYFIMVGMLFMGMKSYTNERAAAVALFVSGIIAILLRISNWLNDFGVYLGLMLMVVSLFLLWKKND